MSKKIKTQTENFRDAARALGCDESEAAFDAALGKIARHKPKVDKDTLAKRPDKNDQRS